MPQPWKKELIFGLDIGQVNDPSALVLVEKVRLELPEYAGRTFTPKVRTEYNLLSLDRWLGVNYVEQVAMVKERLTTPAIRVHAPLLLVDQTGVGKAVTDMLREVGLSFWGVQIHGGSTTRREGMVYYVAKKDLVAAVQVARATPSPCRPGDSGARDFVPRAPAIPLYADPADGA
jgi:hypothetical protein